MIAPTGVEAAKMAKCLRIAERDRGVISNEVVSANAAGAEEKIYALNFRCKF